MNPDRVPYEKWGLTVYTWLRPPAQTWFNELDIERLEQAGGHLLIFSELDKGGGSGANVRGAGAGRGGNGAGRSLIIAVGRDIR